MISAFGITDIGGSAENQDTFLVTDRMFVVADGHGRGGCEVAMAATAVFASPTISEPPSFDKLFEYAESVARTIPSEKGNGNGNGGTTLSALYVNPDGSCEVAHVGDSEVRYFDEDANEGVSLTTDHSACSLEEFKRIRSMQLDRVARFEFAGSHRPVFVEYYGDWIFNQAGAAQHCTVRGDWGSYLVSPSGERLAVTRAIGDFSMKENGVIATPSITSAPPPKPGTVRAIVMASDGLWDAMTYEEVCAIVRRPDLLGNAEAATKALMAASLETARLRFGPQIDNVTAVVIYLTA